MLQVWSTLATVPIFGFTLGPGFLLGTASVLLSTLLYGGAIKIPGDYWNREPAMCARARQLGASKASGADGDDLDLESALTARA
eukprot:COSAG01_NODE_289_length_19391_cov_119.323122_14_plen_84_part_00